MENKPPNFNELHGYTKLEVFLGCAFMFIVFGASGALWAIALWKLFGVVFRNN